MASRRLDRCRRSLELNHRRVETARVMLIAELAAIRWEFGDEAGRDHMIASRLVLLDAIVTKVDEGCAKLAAVDVDWMSESNGSLTTTVRRRVVFVTHREVGVHRHVSMRRWPGFNRP